jgi:hypothetical protein
MKDILKLRGKIGILDNDLLTRKNHNFPNLALMKISAYLKNNGCNVELASFESFNSLFGYDYYVLSKVFSDTITPRGIIESENVIYGGSGFYYDRATRLPDEIEHTFPDYSLYKPALDIITKGKNHYFKNHSIGFMTRGCIRGCEFCINKNYKKVEKHSPLSEFLDESKHYITLLDDNITAYKGFESVISELKETGKPFTFKQGMDFRLLNEKRMRLLSDCKTYGRSDANTRRVFYFAFDDYGDKAKIVNNLTLWNSIFHKSTEKIFYVFVGFPRDRYTNYYDDDYSEMIARVKILYQNNAKPYIMPYNNVVGHKHERKIKIIKQFCNYVIKLGNNTLADFCDYNKIDKSLFTTDELKIGYKYSDF